MLDLWHKGEASSFDRKAIGIVRPETIVKSLPGSHPPFGANSARRRKHRHGCIAKVHTRGGIMSAQACGIVATHAD
jgi:hypothetical protein